MKSLASFVLLSSLLMLGCHTQHKPVGLLTNSDFLDGLYVTRPEIEEPMIAILKLRQSALLETAKREHGQLTIDKNLLSAIEQEQTQTIEELQKISPKIRVLIRYRLVLNGLAIWAPADVFEKIKGLPNVVMGEKSATFARPQEDEKKVRVPVGPRTSVKFIGADAAYAENISGQGMRIGIIDTGIDYTHKMFLGEGTEEAYKNNSPDLPNNSFPNKKVVGGLDFVGTDYNSGSPEVEKRIPKPDANPLDEGGHGTHVAGTVAGLGDGINTYDGVAPAAELYALKVFGAKGSTSDEVVIAALEYAADPTGDLSFKKQLDVVNLSLGSGHGNPHIMYNHAIRNLVRGGTVVVAAAGNNGDKPYIVGAPGVSDDAISVASSIDNTNQNVQFPAAEFLFEGQSSVVEIMEGAITKPLEELTTAEGELIYAGLADKDFEPSLKEQLKGKVAFIDRGKVSFAEKIKRAEDAGAIAVVVANSVDGAPFVMGGEGKFAIPGVMITKQDANLIKEKLKQGSVSVQLKSSAKVDKPELIDTISDFSSRGPRSEDGMIKPEITAPGSNIISADMGAGDKGVPLSGTSMATPHVAGFVALLKQKHQNLTVDELKSVLLSQGKVLQDLKKNNYSVSRQGAGRVQVAESLKAKIVTSPATLSFGITDLEKQKILRKSIEIKNISFETLSLRPVWEGAEGMRVSTSVSSMSLAPGESRIITIEAKVLAQFMKNQNDELDGFLKFVTDQGSVAHLPALVVARQISQISAKSLTIYATTKADSAGSAADLILENKGVNKGAAYVFNLLGKDSRKKDPKPDLAHNKNCDLQSAGYRIIKKEGAQILQFAFKLFEGQTTWHSCEVNVQVDSDRDGKTDQEIAGLPAENLPGMKGEEFVSLLLDGNTARELRKKSDPVADYTPALIDQRGMRLFDNSTLAIIEADLAALTLADTGELRIKVSTTHQDAGAIEYDDYLGNQDREWSLVSTQELGQSFAQIPEEILLEGKESKTISLVKGFGGNALVVYAPQNRSVRDGVLEDSQSQVVRGAYKETLQP